jgi:hypothetical protein
MPSGRNSGLICPVTTLTTAPRKGGVCNAKGPRPCPRGVKNGAFALMEDSQQVGYEENQQYRTQPYAGTPAGTPAAIAVVSATGAEDQQQNNEHEEHFFFLRYHHCTAPTKLLCDGASPTPLCNSQSQAPNDRHQAIRAEFAEGMQVLLIDSRFRLPALYSSARHSCKPKQAERK